MIQRDKMRMVNCAKLKRRLPGLAKPPIPGELGQRIYDSISQQAWDMWQEHSRLLINHYGLNLADPDARTLLRQEMERFLFGGDDDKPEGWTPDDSDGPSSKGKGAPAAPQKK
jgi:Fe-S cluster biosynthesis and repair protein YggX